MNQQAATLVSLELTTRSTPPIAPLDASTGETPAFWRGEDLVFRIGIFDSRGFPIDLSNLDFLEVDIFPLPVPARQPTTNIGYAPYGFNPYPTRPPAPLLTVTLTADDIEATITRAGWVEGIEQNGLAAFSWVDTLSLNLGGFPSRQFGFVVHGLTAAKRKITYGGGPVTVYETGEQGIYLPNHVAPVVVPEATIFLVEENRQIPFAVPIQVDGDMVIDGYLIEVASVGSGGDFDPSDFDPSDFNT